MAAEINGDPWATLDDVLGVEVAETADLGVGPVAFYGRCSTEDNQDPETSHAWQLGNARKFIEPLGGTIAADFSMWGSPARCLGTPKGSLAAAGGVEGSGPRLRRRGGR